MRWRGCSAADLRQPALGSTQVDTDPLKPLRSLALPTPPAGPKAARMQAIEYHAMKTARLHTLSQSTLSRPAGVTQVESEPAQPLKSAVPPPPPPSPKAQPVPAPAPAPASKEQGVDFGSFFKGALDSPATPPKVHKSLTTCCDACQAPSDGLPDCWACRQRLVLMRQRLAVQKDFLRMQEAGDVQGQLTASTPFYASTENTASLGQPCPS